MQDRLPCVGRAHGKSDAWRTSPHAAGTRDVRVTQLHAAISMHDDPEGSLAEKKPTIQTCAKLGRSLGRNKIVGSPTTNSRRNFASS